MRNLLIYDTTLRDGEQAPGNSMTMAQKIELFKQLDDLGVDYIDVGFPASSPLDFEACQFFAKLQRRAKISALARANQEDISTTFKAFGENENVQIQILLLGSEIHVKNKRKITIEQSIEEATNAVRYAKKLGMQDISVALEDATRGSLNYLKLLINSVVAEGATTVVLPDTVGAMIPQEIFDLVLTIKSWVKQNIAVSIHCHNDMGLATANTLAALEAGASCIQTTLCGIGERAGNAALEEVLTVLTYKQDYYQIRHKIDLGKLHTACNSLISMLKLAVGKHKPIVGSNAFATAAGIHIHGLLNDPLIYEFVKPNHFNQNQEIFLSRHLGKSAVRNKIKELNLFASDALVNAICEEIKKSENAAIYNEKNYFIGIYEKCKLLIKGYDYET